MHRRWGVMLAPVAVIGVLGVSAATGSSSVRPSQQQPLSTVMTVGRAERATGATSQSLATRTPSAAGAAQPQQGCRKSPPTRRKPRNPHKRAGAVASTRARKQTATVGTVLYKKNWEDGVIDSGGWIPQSSDTVSSNPLNGIVYGTITPDAVSVDSGRRAGKFYLPAWSSGMQGVEMLHDRVVKDGEDDWFSIAMYFPDGWAQAMTSTNGSALSETVTCPNYYSVNGCMDALVANRNSIFALTNSGACSANDQPPGCPYYSGNPDYPGVHRGFSQTHCGPWYVIPPGSLRLGVWYEFVFHVYYTLKLDGVVQAWYRLKGHTQWTLAVDEQRGFPTLQTGPTAFGDSVTADNVNGWKSTDQFGAYRHASPNPATMWVDNWCRATSFTAASSCFK